MVDRAYQSYIMSLTGYSTLVDIIIFDMVVFNVILGMDWLSLYHAILDYFAKIITLAISGESRVQ